jgi:hypothetical protein
LDRARELGISRSDLVRLLGYRNITNGHKALSTALLSGVVAPQIGDRLASALAADEAVVSAVIDATTQQKRDEACRFRIEREQAYSDSFRPHLHVHTERHVPSPIFLAALLAVARLRIIHLPVDAIAAAGETQDRIIKTIILDHCGARLAGMFQRSARSQDTSWCWSRHTAGSISACRIVSMAIQPGGCRRSSGFGRRLWGRGAVM